MNAAIVLIRNGFVQESYILCRSIDEDTEAIFFLAQKLSESGTSPNQAALVKDFYQELLSNPDDPTEITKSTAPRKSDVRKFPPLVGGETNAQKMDAISRSMYRIFSGYAHGSYACIMELYGQVFHTRGMLGTPRMKEGIASLANHIYRTILAVMVVSSRTGRTDLYERLKSLRDLFASRTGCVE